ncbi:MAG: hypothetical protein ACYC6Y_24160, partial [Thermoguttaceae bacterium]
LRQVVHLRARLIDYFVRGEMARPPRLEGPVPKVTADWQWSGVWPVTTDAVLTGAWRLPAENRLVLMFVNVSEEPVEAALKLDRADYGLPSGELTVRRVTADGIEEARLGERLTFAAKAAWAWEIVGK